MLPSGAGGEVGHDDRRELRRVVVEHRGVEALQGAAGRGVLERGGAQRVARQRGDGGGLGALARHVADDERPLGRRALEDVVEVAADLVELAGGAIAGGHQRARDLRQALGQELDLQGVGDPAALGVEPGVVDRHAGARRELLGQLDVGLLEEPARTRRWPG